LKSGLRSPNDYELWIMDYEFYNTRDEGLLHC